MELIFTDKNTKGISELLETVRNNSFGDFDVDPNALTVVITGAVHYLSNLVVSSRKLYVSRLMIK